MSYLGSYLGQSTSTVEPIVPPPVPLPIQVVGESSDVSTFDHVARALSRFCQQYKETGS